MDTITTAKRRMFLKSFYDFENIFLFFIVYKKSINDI